MSAEFKTNLPPVSDAVATGVVKDIMEATKAKFGFVPNMYRGMGNSAGYLSTYIHGYTQFREGSGFTPQEQEVVFLVISGANDCGYCTAAHSMIADRLSKLDPQTLAAIRTGEPIADAKLAALAAFTTEVFQTRGKITNAAAKAFVDAGYQEGQMMEVVLALAVKTLSNYSNHIFHTEVDEAFGPYRI